MMAALSGLLCRNPTPDNKHRRKLHGISYSSPKAVLERLVKDNLELNYDINTVRPFDPDAYFCSLCVRKLNSIHSNVHQLTCAPNGAICTCNDMMTSYAR